MMSMSTSIMIMIIVMVMVVMMMMVTPLLCGRWCVCTVLGLPQLPVQRPLAGEQLRVRAALRHAAALQHQDLVTRHHRAQPVRDDDGGAAPRGRGQRRHDARLRDGVEAGGGLVKHQDGGVLQDGPGDGHPLLLPARQLQSPLSHLHMISVYYAVHCDLHRPECRSRWASPGWSCGALPCWRPGALSPPPPPGPRT